MSEKDKNTLENIRDCMGELHNEIVELIKKSDLTVPQVYIVFRLIEKELLESAEKIYVTN